MMRLLAVLAVLTSCLAARAASSAFQAGDRWVALGDSITQTGAYHRELELFYLTRQPGMGLHTFNRGIAGDTAKGALLRLDWDCLSVRPTVATVMLGMNDVGRDLYAPGKAGPEVEKLRADRARAYGENLRRIVGRLRDAGARVVLVSPTPYDDTVRAERPNAPGCNAALAALTALAADITRETGADFIDLHTPLTALNLERQKEDPTYTLIGPDRIHPGRAGHLAIAGHILRAQEAPRLVFSLHLDASTPAVLDVARARAVDLAASPSSLAFTVDEESLPYPADPADQTGESATFDSEFNQQLLRVTGLAAGRWSLTIDGERVGDFTDAQLAAGVDLRSLPSTPQLRQARLVRAALAEKWEAEAGLRTLAYARHGAWPDAPRPFDPAEMQARVNARRATTGRANAWIDAQLARHAELQARETELLERVAAAATRAREAAAPAARRYALNLLAPASP